VSWRMSTPTMAPPARPGPERVNKILLTNGNPSCSSPTCLFPER
jgi:hypothetical protein